MQTNTTMKSHMLSIVIIFLGIVQCGNLSATVYPGGGTTLSELSIGSPVHIRWTDDLKADLVDICLWDGDRQKFITVAKGIPFSQHELTWSIPADIKPGTHFRFFIRDNSDSNNMDLSSGFISIGLKGASASNIGELPASPDLWTAPSPVSNALTIGWDAVDMQLLELIDGLQRIVMQQPLAPGQTSANLNMTTVSAGLYFVRLHSASGNVSIEPIIVSR
jgi:hypothetical protein